jgi:hypothetical protein
VSRASPDKWARRSPRKRGPTAAQNGWAELGPEYYFSLGLAEPGPYIWAGPNQVRPTSHVYYFCRNMNSYCSRSACNQTVAKAIDGRSEVGGNLAWSGAGGTSGGRNGGGVGCLWRRKKEEENLQGEREELMVAAP